MLLKKDEHSIKNLLAQLSKINEHLGKKETRFLTGDTLCCFDCELMPRLQHIRVAGRNKFTIISFLFFFRFFKIPDLKDEIFCIPNRSIFCAWIFSAREFDSPLEVHGKYVQFGCIHPVLSC